MRHPSEYWTFQGVCSEVFSDGRRPSLSADELAMFLDINRELVINPITFRASNIPTELNLNMKEISIRSIVYTGITSSNVRDAREVASILGFDEGEVLRIIVQTCRKFPEKKFENRDHNLESAPSDQVRNAYNYQRLVFYCDIVLHERRLVAYLCLDSLLGKREDLFDDSFFSTDYAIQRIVVLETIMKNLQDTSHQAALSEDLRSLIINDEIAIIILSLRIIAAGFNEIPAYNKQIVKRWFEFIEYFGFVNEALRYLMDDEQLTMMKLYISCISFQLLKVDTTTGELMNSESYFHDLELFGKLNLIITKSLYSDAILAYTWLTILQKKLSSFRLESKANKEEHFDVSNLYESQISLERRQLEFNLYKDFHNIRKKLTPDYLLEEIADSVLLNALSVLDINPSTSYCFLQSQNDDAVSRNAFYKDCFRITKEKFPVLIATYLNLNAISVGFRPFFSESGDVMGKMSYRTIFDDLKNMETYATKFERSEFLNLFKVGDEGSSVVCLKDSIDILGPYETNEKFSLRFEKGSKAIYLQSSTDCIVVFSLKYNGWIFLGRTLENLANDTDSWDDARIETILSILEAIDINLSNLESEVSSSIKWMSKNLDRSDIFEVLFDLLDTALKRKNLDICKAIVMIFLLYSRAFEFDRIWDFLIKSSLLSNEAIEGSALDILSSTEQTKGEYDFTFDLLYFLGDLISNKDFGTKCFAISKILKYAIAVYEKSNTLNFNQYAGRMFIHWWVVWVLREFINDRQSKDYELVGPSENAYLMGSEIIERYFLNGEESERVVMPILTLIDFFNENAKDIDQLVYIPRLTSFHRMSEILLFYRLLISRRSSKKMKPSALERALYRRLPPLISMYAQRSVFQVDLLYLLISLMKAEWKADARLLILNYMGEYHSQVLLCSLATNLRDPSVSHPHKTAIYTFVSLALSLKQNDIGLLFQGNEHFEDRAGYQAFKKNIFFPDVLESMLDDIGMVPYLVSFCLADAIFHCADSWPNYDVDKVFRFVKKVLSALEYVVSKDNDANVLSRIRLKGQLLRILTLFSSKTESNVNQEQIIHILKSSRIVRMLQNGIESNEIVDDFQMDSSKRRFYPGDIEGFPPFLYKNTYDLFYDESYEHARQYEARATDKLLAVLQET